MPDSQRGRRLVLVSLVVVFALSTALDLWGTASAPAVRYGRPLAMALSCLLVWQRRLWARWLVALLALGILFAGPLAMANGLGPWTLGGALLWAVSFLTAGSLFTLFRSPDARAYLSPAATDVPPPSVSAGA